MYEARDAFLISDIAYIDLAKAFDKVSHSKLLHKLSYYGVSGNLYKWLKYYLLDRKQRVKINDSFSNFSPAYISYIRPIVESDSSVWNPDNFICNSNNIENIQIYFTKILFYRCNLIKRSYKDRIIFLNIKTLFHRRLLAILP